jgi:hypothetical protein
MYETVVNMYDPTANKLKEIANTSSRFCPSKKILLYLRKQTALETTELMLKNVDKARNSTAITAAYMNGS